MAILDKNLKLAESIYLEQNNIDEAIEHCGLTLTQTPSAKSAPKV